MTGPKASEYFAYRERRRLDGEMEPVTILMRDNCTGRLLVEFSDGYREWIGPYGVETREQVMKDPYWGPRVQAQFPPKEGAV